MNGSCSRGELLASHSDQQFPKMSVPRLGSTPTQEEGTASIAATAGAEAFNKAALREREYFAAKLEAPLQHVVAPPPLHDFTHDDAGAFGATMSKSGVPGRRLLRLRSEIAPQNTLACENEPEGPRTNPDQIDKVVDEREGLLVYRCTFQDLPPSTPAVVTQRLDSVCADSAAGPENLTALRAFYVPESEDDKVLVFESRFESGNLHSAHQVAPFEYDLKLSNDTGTSGHTQWFYFSVSNTRKGIPYKFNINNMLKPDSLYNHGLRPLAYSIARYREELIGWHRTGDQILYYSNKISAAKRKTCHTLTFTITFSHNHDTCYLSHCYPYTYGDLQSYLDQLELNSECRSFVRRKVLCETEAGNKCDVLTITSRSGDEEEMRRRKGIIISARVHPGETNASWMMKGCIDFLLSDEEEARELRRKFVFKIIPMLCPDGVINGNYRCGIAGHDMNRRWARPNPKQHSTIFHTKLMIEELMQDRDIVLFCDLHGHSRKKNVFLYGCDARSWNRKLSSTAAPVALSERVFPMLMDEKSQSFALRYCRFKVQRSKSSTGRVVCWRQMGIHNSYTVEASFCSADEGDQVGIHFGISALEGIGKCLCLSVLEQFGKSDANYESLLHRVQSDPVVVGEDDGDSESDDSSSDDEVALIKTPAKLKANKNGPNPRISVNAERPSSAVEVAEKDLSKETPSTTPVQNSRRIQPRAKCLRSTSRTSSHRRPTLSARARTAEPRNPDAVPANSLKDKLREFDVASPLNPKVLVLRDAPPTNTAHTGSIEYMSVTDQLLADETRQALRVATGQHENKVDTLRDRRDKVAADTVQRKVKELGDKMRWSARPPRAAPCAQEDKGRSQEGRSPLQGLQDLQRIAEKTRVEAAAPTTTKTVHTVLFTADVLQDATALRRPVAHKTISCSLANGLHHLTPQHPFALRRTLRTPSPVRKLSSASFFSKSMTDLSNIAAELSGADCALLPLGRSPVAHQRPWTAQPGSSSHAAAATGAPSTCPPRAPSPDVRYHRRSLPSAVSSVALKETAMLMRASSIDNTESWAGTRPVAGVADKAGAWAGGGDASITFGLLKDLTAPRSAPPGLNYVTTSRGGAEVGVAGASGGLGGLEALVPAGRRLKAGREAEPMLIRGKVATTVDLR